MLLFWFAFCFWVVVWFVFGCGGTIFWFTSMQFWLVVDVMNVEVFGCASIVCFISSKQIFVFRAKVLAAQENIKYVLPRQ